MISARSPRLIATGLAALALSGALGVTGIALNQSHAARADATLSDCVPDAATGQCPQSAAPSTPSPAVAGQDSGQIQAQAQMPTTLHFDRTCYTFAGDTMESCGIRLSRGDSEALLAAAKALGSLAFVPACTMLLAPFVGAGPAGTTCIGLYAYISNYIKLPDGQTIWIGTSGPQTGNIYLVDIDSANASVQDPGLQPGPR